MTLPNLYRRKLLASAVAACTFPGWECQSPPPPYPGTPRWAKVFGTIAVVVMLLFFLALLTRGAHHG